MAKPIKTILKLQLPAGKATTTPPVGTVLGPHGINIGDFVKKFNEQTSAMGDNVIPAEITIFEDRTFTFVLKTSPAADMLKKAAGIEKGSGNPLKEKVGKVKMSQIREIAEKKMEDLNANSVEQAMKIIEGSARSMGIEVEN